MFAAVRSLFQKDSVEEMSAVEPDNVPLAAAVLLLDLALSDDSFEATEEQKIVTLLMRKFDCSKPEAMILLQEANAHLDEKDHFYTYTKILKDNLDDEGRAKIIEMLWEVAYADGDIGEFEEKIMQRLCGILMITEQQCAHIRQQVHTRLQNTQAY